MAAGVVAMVAAAADELTLTISCANMSSRHSATWLSRAHANSAVRLDAFLTQMSAPLFNNISTDVLRPFAAAICKAVSPFIIKVE